MDLEKIIIFLLVLATAVLAGLIYLYMIKVYITLKFKGVRVMGHVSDFHIERVKDANGQETGSSRQPVFSFEADGQVITGMPKYMTSSRFQIGDEVDITYHADKPHVFVASDEIEGKRLWPGFIFLVLLFGGVIFLFLKFWDSGRMVESCIRFFR